MRVFVAGATGAIGAFLVPELLANNHRVIALTRNRQKAAVLESAGASAVVADPLDTPALIDAIVASAPDAIINELTALSNAGNFRKFDQEFALTNRFRTDVTAAMIVAAKRCGAKRLIAQSFCGWPFAREGGAVKTEEDPLDPNPPASITRTFAAIRTLEDMVLRTRDVDAFALRYGLFYGPGTAFARDGVIVRMVAKRQFPIVGDGTGVWSFIHVADAARATVAALTRGAPGIYNVVDDEPAPVAEWLPALAAAVGAKPPRRIPLWLGRLLLGDGGAAMMTNIRGGSNAKAKREFGWRLEYPTWRRGFVEGLG